MDGEIAGPPARPVKVLLVNDHEVVLEGLASMLASQRDRLTIVGATTDPADVTTLTADFAPDLVLLDVRLKLVVVLAGYRDRMDEFFQSNPGMGSRIAHHIDFPDYTSDELMEIARLMLDEQRYELTPPAEVAFQEYLERRMAQPRFANARSVRNAIERARLRQANRVVADRSRRVGKSDLMRIEEDDIRRSRVFANDGRGDT